MPTLLLATHSAHAGEMAGPKESLVTLYKPAGVYVTGAYARSDRDVRFESRVSPIQFSRYTVATGIQILPFLMVGADLSSIVAEVGVIDSSGGMEWGIGARAALWEYVIQGSPTLPRRHAIRIEVDAAYHEASMKISGVYFGTQLNDPNIGIARTDEYFKWSELSISPLIRYTHNRSTEGVWNHRMPTGVSTYIGPHYSDWDIEHNPLTGTGNSDLGMRLGSDIRMSNGWLLHLDAILFDGSDRRYTIGVGYYF